MIRLYCGQWQWMIMERSLIFNQWQQHCEKIESINRGALDNWPIHQDGDGG